MMKMIKNIHIISLSYSIFLVFSSIFAAVTAQNNPVNVEVGVVLDFDKGFGKMGLSCIKMSLSDFYASHPNYTTRLLLHQRNSPTDVVLTAAAALDLINNVEVQAIIGPESSMQANFVISLGNKSHVPIISFSATSPSLTSIRTPYFIRATQNDSSQVKAISALIQAFGWRQVVPIYVDNEFGEGVIPYLSDALQQVDVRIPYRAVLSSRADDEQIETELLKLMAMQTRVFIVHMLPELGTRVFERAKEIGMMDEGYVWIMTDGMFNMFSYISFGSVVENMQGALGLKPYVPSTNELEDFRVRWKRKFQQDNPGVDDVDLGVFGLWAHDAAKALAMAVEEVVTSSNESFGFQKVNSSGSSNDLERIGVSEIGLRLVEALSRTNFIGLSGRFSLLNGQLQSSTLQIVNVIGKGEKVIGYWTLENGLVRSLNSKTTVNSSYSTSNTSLGSIIWPGDSISAPKGWQIPTSGKKLKILVPIKSGFKEFVNVTHDSSSNTNKVGGYCIDVFEAVKNALPYDIDYELIPFAKPDGESPAGNYNDLVNEVFLGKYDAAVGDLTIRANRSLYIDFTLPFTESGVSMIVPIKDDKNKNAWVFLKPLTWDLWLTSGCFFIFIGFVVWVLEHRINEDFRGPPLHQIGTSFWFSFSTMVFAHRERVVSNLARFVVIIWCFVVLILTQSYTASLTSLLTVQQLQPTVTDVNLLLKNGDNVGYQSGSFVYGILKQLGFQDNKLRTYDTVEQLNELFHNGTANNGIAAAFDETPYMKLFLATYCSKYTMVEPTFKADGFAFVFPKDSPLARDVSRAILNVNEGGEMDKIEDRWFKKQQSCQNTSNNNVSSNSLSLESFWGLFLIAGVASSLALLIFVAMFLYEHKDIRLDSESSFWRKVFVMLRIYDQKDLSSHTFKKSGLQFHTNYPSTPSSYSNHTEAHNVFSEQSTSSPEHGDLSPTNGQSTREIELAIEHP
ncbi:putative periplasmic binding protein-like I [Rosa chinensis]|uniref:Glutamate receptor n=1 Tax=Rosa chinensis TaxID=74649 RepID=A0A2P6PZL2_ROSCH|nr:glutamate receptor 2.8 [Rosa chinensis]PRQ27361.1 putative periplasmic binding protein-like I [Rosa chinensis]